MDRSLDGLVEGVRAADRTTLGVAITLIESSLPDDRELADQLLRRLAASTGSAHRIGITGAPGVGKSSFIEAFGLELVERGRRVAVVAVDPSSTLSGGSILGDKTRMPELARRQQAFIRPSPSGATTGGVARRTREVIRVCEAAGYDVVLVETVGVGQSEAAVADMVDFFLVLVLAGAGDELQGIKRGVLELADLIAVTKADGTNLAAAELARGQYASALHLMSPVVPEWDPPVVTCSALERSGIDAIWDHAAEHRSRLEGSGAWTRRREAQRLRWMWETLDDGVHDRLHSHPAVVQKLAALEPAVRAGSTTPDQAASELLDAFTVAIGSVSPNDQS